MTYDEREAAYNVQSEMARSLRRHGCTAVMRAPADGQPEEIYLVMPEAIGIPGLSGMAIPASNITPLLHTYAEQGAGRQAVTLNDVKRAIENIYYDQLVEETTGKKPGLSVAVPVVVPIHALETAAGMAA